MMTYMIYWVIQLPFMLVSPQKIRHLFTAKAVIVPLAWLTILIWAMVKAPPSISLEPKHSKLSGSSLRWAWLHALNSALGGYATLAVNIPDFTVSGLALLNYDPNFLRLSAQALCQKSKIVRLRFSTLSPALLTNGWIHSQLVQLAVMPVAFTFMAFVGIAVTSAGEVLYNETLWDPLDLIEKWDNRAAAFFAAASFFLATLGTNIATNSLSAANDLAALCPKYVNIRRGQVICAVLGGWALCPWEILASAPKFLTFVSGYSIFFAPFAGM